MTLGLAVYRATGRDDRVEVVNSRGGVAGYSAANPYPTSTAASPRALSRRKATIRRRPSPRPHGSSAPVRGRCAGAVRDMITTHWLDFVAAWRGRVHRTRTPRFPAAATPASSRRALPYFGATGVLPTQDPIPLTHFKGALDWLRSNGVVFAAQRTGPEAIAPGPVRRSVLWNDDHRVRYERGVRRARCMGEAD